MSASSASCIDVFVLVEIEFFGGLVDEQDKAGLFVHDDDAFLQVVEQLFIAGAQNLCLDEEQADYVDDNVHGEEIRKLEHYAADTLSYDRRRYVLVVNERTSCDLKYLDAEHADAGRPKIEIEQTKVEDSLVHENFQLHLTKVARQALLEYQVDYLVVDVHFADCKFFHADEDQEEAPVAHHNHSPFYVGENFFNQDLVVLLVLINVGFALLVIGLSHCAPDEHEDEFEHERDVGAVGQNEVVVAPGLLVVNRGKLALKRRLQHIQDKPGLLKEFFHQCLAVISYSYYSDTLNNIV